MPSEAADPLDRYSRQIRFPALGESGQRKLMESRVTICGCGASAPFWPTTWFGRGGLYPDRRS